MRKEHFTRMFPGLMFIVAVGRGTAGEGKTIQFIGKAIVIGKLEKEGGDIFYSTTIAGGNLTTAQSSQ